MPALLLVSRPVLDPYRRANESERPPNLILKEPPIREVQLHRAIGEQDEGGWGNRGLSHVINLDLLLRRHGRALKVDCFQEAIHFCGWKIGRASCRERVRSAGVE